MDPSENTIDNSENSIDNVSGDPFCMRGMCAANPEDNEHVRLEMREMDERSYGRGYNATKPSLLS